MAASAVEQSSVVSPKIETQSSERQAGTTPAVEISPRLGLRPTMLLRAARPRPEPAGGQELPRGGAWSLSLCWAPAGGGGGRGVWAGRGGGGPPAATATAEPELAPPGISAGLRALRGMP